MTILYNVDLNQNEIQNAVIQPLASAPASAVIGQVYYNSTDHYLYQYNGTAWSKVGVTYSQTSSTNSVITGLTSAGGVTTSQVDFLTISPSYTPVSGGVVGAGAKLSEALNDLDTKLTSVDTNSLKASLKGAPSGLAELDANGKVISAQLPSYVDDVIEGYYNSSTSKFYAEVSFTTIITGETGKIYVDLSTNLTYRWSGTAYVLISSSLALGETSSTAYRGDRGKTAYDHSQLAGGTNPHATTFANINSKPTTIAGYGITDAKIASGVITLGANTITPLTAASSLDSTKLTGTAAINTTGSAATATKATQDASGNDIAATYATKAGANNDILLQTVHYSYVEFSGTTLTGSTSIPKNVDVISTDCYIYNTTTGAAEKVMADVTCDSYFNVESASSRNMTFTIAKAVPSGYTFRGIMVYTFKAANE